MPWVVLEILNPHIPPIRPPCNVTGFQRLF